MSSLAACRELERRRPNAWRFYMLSLPEEEAQCFADAIVEAKHKVKTCPVCQNLTDQELCPICADSRRDHSVICVVAEPRDLIALERAREYQGCTMYCMASSLP